MTVSTVAAHLGAAWVAAQPGDYDPSSGRGPEWGKAAPAGLLIWLFLGVSLFFLVRSMNRHMRKVREQSAAGAESGGAGAAASADSAAGDGGPGDSASARSGAADGSASAEADVTASAGGEPPADQRSPS